jgi:RHS repeat-associated protein
MAAADEERIPPLTRSEENFSLAVPFAAVAPEHRIGANAPEGKKPHQGIFSTNHAVRINAMRPKWLRTHQVSGQWWSETVLGIVIDANGNTLTDPSGKSYTWDFENRLTQAVVPGTNGGTTTFKYDPFGRRIYKQSPSFTSVFLYDGADLLETVSGSGSEVASYAQGLGVDEMLAMQRGGTADYYDADGLGSITSLSSSAGALANTYIYDSFGNLTASTGTRRNYVQYTGREFDAETGLNYNRARYYNPTTGRFISEDPLGFSGGGPNFYAYVGNDPVLFIDPTGLCTNNPRPPCHASNSFTDKTIRFFSLWRLPETWKEWVLGGGAKYTYVKALQAGATSAGGAESAGAAAIGVAGEGLALAGSVAMVGATMADIDCQIGPVEPYTEK